MQFLVNMFVADSRTGMPEFSKILAFMAVLIFFGYEGYNLFFLKQPFDMPAFAHSIAYIFGGLSVQLGVSEFFRQRFDKLQGISRDGNGIEVQSPPAPVSAVDPLANAPQVPTQGGQ